jgi:hypothetical protein
MEGDFNKKMTGFRIIIGGSYFEIASLFGNFSEETKTHGLLSLLIHDAVLAAMVCKGWTLTKPAA